MIPGTIGQLYLRLLALPNRMQTGLVAKAKASLSQKIAIGIIETVIGLAILAGVLWLVVKTIVNVATILKEGWASWLGAWLGLCVVATLISGALAPHFTEAIVIGLGGASIAMVGILLLLGLLGAFVELYEDVFE